MADQSACAAGDGFEYVSAVDRAPVDRLKGEFDEPTWKIARAAVADVPCPPCAPSCRGRSRSIGLQSLPGQRTSCGDPSAANSFLTCSLGTPA